MCARCGKEVALSMFIMNHAKFDPSLVICQKCRTTRAREARSRARMPVEATTAKRRG